MTDDCVVGNESQRVPAWQDDGVEIVDVDNRLIERPSKLDCQQTLTKSRWQETPWDSIDPKLRKQPEYEPPVMLLTT